MTNNTHHTLYRAYSSHELLYIGISDDWPSRWRQHTKSSPWYPRVTNIWIEHYPDRESAMAAERTAIETERPTHNVLHNSRITKTPPHPHTEDHHRTSNGPLAYSPTELANKLGVTRQHVQNLIARGELPSFKFGRSRLIPAHVVDELLAST